MIDVIKYCEAAEHIKEEFGLEKSLKYLIGEKFHSCLKQLKWSLSSAKETENKLHDKTIKIKRKKFLIQYLADFNSLNQYSQD